MPIKIVLYDHKEKTICDVCKKGVKMHAKRMDVGYCSRGCRAKDWIEHKDNHRMKCNVS